MRIAICDDEPIFLRRYSQIIKEFKTMDEMIEVQTFTCGLDLIDDIELMGSHYDLVFLDIVMAKIDGIATAKRLKQLCAQTEIVFLTSSEDYALASYEVEALSYILKNNQVITTKIHDILTKVTTKQQRYLVIRNKSAIEKIAVTDILYIESNRRKILVKTPTKTYETYEQLSGLLFELETQHFVRCHRSYAVNLRFIQKITPKEILLTTGEAICVSRGNVEAVKTAFITYLQQC
ncbi:MAG: LytR/AlgR family response regulator transcription factor [Culicoidibacterales bacterium]